MAPKTTYSEAELKQFMEDLIGATADKLGIRAEAGHFDTAVDETMYIMGVSDLTSINTLAEARKLRLVARREAWRFVAASTVHEASFSSGSPGTGSTNRADIHRHAKAMFDLANAELITEYPDLIVASSRSVIRTTVQYPFSPYEDYDD